MDGAYGTSIAAYSKGLAFAEEVNVKNPSLLERLHVKYVESGADIIKTNTFGVFHLLNAGKIDEEYALKLIDAGTKIARKAAGDNIFVVASFGPMSDSVFEYEKSVIDFFGRFYSEACKVAVENNVDGILFETFTDFLELKTAILAVKNLYPNLPVIAQFTFNENGVTLGGAHAENCGAFLETLPADVIGVNCSTGPEHMAETFKKLGLYSTKPMSVSPNAGMPFFENGKVVYKDSREIFKKLVPFFADYGARIIGSCCGSDYRYTYAIKKALLDSGKRNTPFFKKAKKDFLVSPSQLFDFKRESFLAIGERMNLLGNQSFKQNFLTNPKVAFEEELNKQLSAGCVCVDLNLDLVVKNQPEQMEDYLLILQNIAKPIISIDTLYPHVMKSAVKYLTCTPIYNSTDLTEERFEKVVKLYKVFGGKIIVLLMSGKKIPKTLSERENGLKLIDILAEQFGIDKRDILVDPLALTLGTNTENFFYVREIVKKTNYKTVVGLSNFSHGLPDRSRLNAFLLTHLLKSGLTSAILDMSDPNISSVVYNHMAVFEMKGFNLGKGGGTVFSGEYPVFGSYLLKGEFELLEKEIREELRKGVSPTALLENGLIPVMESIGNMFEKGKIYLPQLLTAADTMKKCFEVLRPELEKELASKNKGKEANNEHIVFFTVQNDIHDIGKNIVLTVLKSFGYSVIDGGIDKSPEEIVDIVNNTGASVVGLSALMTTSLPSMEKTVKEIKQKLPNVKVIVGGAVVTKRFAKEIGADGYGKNAFDAVNLVKELL